MLYITTHSIIRLIREGAKSLSVPLIAFVLVVLINLLGGIRLWLETEYDNTIENFPIIAVVSDLTGQITDDMEIGFNYIELFTNPDVHFSLSRFTGDMSMRRTVENISLPGHTAPVTLLGISNKRADNSINPEYGAHITFLDGYDEKVFASNEQVCVISDDLAAQTKNGMLSVFIEEILPDIIVETPIFPPGESIDTSYYYVDGERVAVYHIRVPIPGMEGVGSAWTYEQFFPEFDITIIEGETVSVEKELKVVGTVTGAGYSTVYSPFWAVNALLEELDEFLLFTETLSVTLNDNRNLSDFKGNAAMSFSRVNPVYDSRPFAMTVYDSAFYETLEPLRQNIIVVDVATPFIYILSIAIGFLTSVLLTRRRKAEFAIMRSIGVNKWVVFVSALSEQAILSLAGVALGFAFVAAVWGYASLTRPAVFLGCYLLGAIFAAFGAAGTNVMKVLRDRKE